MLQRTAPKCKSMLAYAVSRTRKISSVSTFYSKNNFVLHEQKKTNTFFFFKGFIIFRTGYRLFKIRPCCFGSSGFSSISDVDDDDDEISGSAEIKVCAWNFQSTFQRTRYLHFSSFQSLSSCSLSLSLSVFHLQNMPTHTRTHAHTRKHTHLRG